MHIVRSALLAAAGAALFGAPSGAQATADETYAGRVRALALDGRCRLFSDEVQIALEAGAALARNALLRGGWSDGAVRRVTVAAAAVAEGLPCNGPDAAGIVAQVETGYEGWSRLSAMAFPGDQRTWNAERLASGEGWLLVQNIADTEGGAALFGLARDATGAILPAIALPSELRARAARMNVRDAALAPTRVEAEYVRIIGATASHPLAAAAAPDVFTRAVWASDRSEQDSKSPYADEFPDGATLLWFPASATAELAALDPREVVAIDLDMAPRSGADERRRLYLEVGDFAPASLFIQSEPAGAF